jgi:hypothetical protein
MKRALLPVSDVRWQVYPSEEEVLLVKMLQTHVNLSADQYMIRIMIDYFMEDLTKQQDLILFAKTYIRPNTSLKSKNKVAKLTRKEILRQQKITNEVNRVLKKIDKMRICDEKK